MIYFQKNLNINYIYQGKGINQENLQKLLS